MAKINKSPLLILFSAGAVAIVLMVVVFVMNRSTPEQPVTQGQLANPSAGEIDPPRSEVPLGEDPDTVSTRMATLNASLSNFEERLDAIERNKDWQPIGLTIPEPQPAKDDTEPSSETEPISPTNIANQVMKQLKATGLDQWQPKEPQPTPLPADFYQTPVDPWQYPLGVDRSRFTTGDRPEPEPSSLTIPDPLQAITDALVVGDQPVYTLPANTTIVSGQSVTALIGRVPVNGQITDAFPFKIVTGPEGFVSNGIQIPPEVSGMVWTGVARGEWSLGCISGDLTSVTFSFPDQTTTTIDIQDVSRRSQNRQRLGFIADDKGLPCIPGEKISDASRVIAQRSIAAAIGDAADAFADARVNTITTGAGSVLQQIEDSAAFGGFSALSGAAGSVQQQIDGRLDQVFDAVYAEVGQPVHVHLEAEIPIDRISNARRVRYAQDQSNQNAVLD